MARILIVDDEPLITAMMEDWLAELGHVVVGPAHNLARALDLADGEIDAAIVDVSLGKDNSYPLVEALIARGAPFALATGHGREGIEPRYRERPMLSEAVRVCDVPRRDRSTYSGQGHGRSGAERVVA